MADTLNLRLQQSGPIPLDVDLSCAAGESLALFGPSGSGKTTILRAIAGLMRPRQGLITLGDNVWLDTEAHSFVPARDRHVGFVFQDYALFPHLTALGNVAVALGHLPRSKRRARAAELLRRVRLDGLFDRRPASLSGGERQRVAVARALARDPKVLLFDEPFSAVDAATRAQLQQELMSLRQQMSGPIVFVTHDLKEATTLARRIALLDAGRIIAAGATEDVLARPPTLQAARLLGYTNIFKAQVLGREPEGGLRIDWHGATLHVSSVTSFPPGARVTWIISPGAPAVSTADGANVVEARIEDIVPLALETRATLRPLTAPDEIVTIEMPGSTARGLALTPGQVVRVALAPDAIHLVPT